MRTIEATPVCEREAPPHKRRRGKHRSKPFKIERRYIGPLREYLAWLFEKDREWHVAGSYETERGRDDALRSEQRGYWAKWYEYRKAEASQ